MINVGEILLDLWNSSGFNAIVSGFLAENGWQSLVMIILACGMFYLGIVKKFEPLLMIGLAAGCLLTNLPGGELYHPELWTAFMNGELGYGTILHDGGLLDIFYIGVKAGVYPCLIFMGVGAMTDFGPLLSNPKSLLLGAAAQMGVFFAFFCATLLGFTAAEAASIGIIGGADGPTAILTPHHFASLVVPPLPCRGWHGPRSPHALQTESSETTQSIDNDVPFEKAEMVLALGGGTVMTRECAEIVHDGTICIYLKASVETLVSHLEGETDNRPMLLGESLRERISGLMDRRSATYESTAHIIIDTDGKTIDEIAETIVRIGIPCRR